MSPPRRSFVALAAGLVAGALTGAISPAATAGPETATGPSSAHAAVPSRATDRRLAVSRLPGVGGEEIVLAAVCEEVAGPPCAAARAAVADLRRTPLSRTVVVVLDPSRSGAGLRAFAEGLPPERRDAVLAAVVLGPAADTTAVSPLGAAARGGARVYPPGWLAHAALAAGEAVGRPVAVADARLPLLGQLVARATHRRTATGAEPFLARGVPSVALAGGDGRLAAAVVRRLDALAGRPHPEDQWLAAAGRVWLRRDLYWVGFVLWALLVARGLPGRFRGTAAAERRRKGRVYLPGFAFRAAFLLAVLATPVFSVLLWPAALLALVPSRHRAVRAVQLVLGLLPAVVWLGAIAAAAARGEVTGWALGLPATALLAAALGSYGFLVGRGTISAPAPPAS